MDVGQCTKDGTGRTLWYGNGAKPFFMRVLACRYPPRKKARKMKKMATITAHLMMYAVFSRCQYQYIALDDLRDRDRMK